MIMRKAEKRENRSLGLIFIIFIVQYWESYYIP